MNERERLGWRMLFGFLVGLQSALGRVMAMIRALLIHDIDQDDNMIHDLLLHRLVETQ